MSWTTAFTQAFAKEIANIRDSFYLFGLITWIPLISFALIIMIFKQGVLYDMPIAVVDLDKSQLSRMISRQMDATSTLHVKQKPLSILEAKPLLRQSDAYAIIVIPRHFERDVRTLKSPQIEAFINSQFILIGKIINSALQQSIMESATRLDVMKNLVQKERFESALSASAPLGIQITPFFNTYQNYFPFLVSALIPAMWQLFIVIATIASIGITFKMKEEHQLFNLGSISAVLFGKLSPYSIAYMLWGLLFLFYMYGTLAWTFEGSFAITILAMLICLIAYQAVAMLLFVVGFDYARALSLGAVYAAPAFAFLGITFPTSSMASFAQVWNELLPITHYIQVQISQANYGASVILMLPYLSAMMLFCLLWFVVIWRIKKQLEKGA